MLDHQQGKPIARSFGKLRRKLFSYHSIDLHLSHLNCGKGNWLILLDPCHRPVVLRTDYLCVLLTKSLQINNKFNVPIKVVLVKFNSSALE